LGNAGKLDFPDSFVGPLKRIALLLVEIVEFFDRMVEFTKAGRLL